MAKRSFNIYSSDGACPNRSWYQDFTPCNTVYVFGDPGEEVVVGIEPAGNFLGYSNRSVEITLDEMGRGALDVSSTSDGLLGISAYSLMSGIRKVNTTSLFREPLTGGDYIDLYSYTTDVPSDGESTAKVYLNVSSQLPYLESQVIQVIAMNNAGIVNCNGASLGEIPVPPSGQVEIAITNLSYGISKIYFHVKGISLSNTLSVDIEFIDLGEL